MAWGGSATAVLSQGLRWASVAAAFYLLLAGAAMLVRSGDWRAPRLAWPVLIFNALLAVQLALNTAANLASRSESERLVMGAASAVGCLLAILALFAPRPAKPDPAVARDG
jgi:hypothetical protein